tara:strand:+ start:970 stop:1407 length:438 start_codon:yes stop_codon:yes gene_type:complete
MRTTAATEECREFYMDRIWQEKPGERIFREIGSLGAFASQVHLWNPDYIQQREQMIGQCNKWPGEYRRHIIKSKINESHLIYLTSKRGIRGIPTYRVTASAWSIKSLDKEIITLKEKLEDLKSIQRHPQLLNGLTWFLRNDNRNK